MLASPKYCASPRTISSTGRASPALLICTEHDPCEMTYMPSAGSPCATIVSSLSQRRSVIASRRSCSWSMRSDAKTATERSTLSMSLPLLLARRKLARLSPHSTPSELATTDAWRGLAYMSASSPKHGKRPSSGDAT